MDLFSEPFHYVENGYKYTDIIFIGSEKMALECSWNCFETLANFSYGKGCPLPEDFKIVFSDGTFLYRDDYDGLVDWALQKPFVMPKITRIIEQIYPSFK